MSIGKHNKIVSIIGARPQFIKLAPLVRAIEDYNKSNPNSKIMHIVIHTGQHYDYLMNKVFFDELSLPEPDYNLEVGSGTHGYQTGEMLKRIEEVLLKEKPYIVIVYGDTNSTLAGALASAKLHIPVAHVEAGLRSYNKKMPEEINRILTDHVSSILFCPTKNAVENLKKEGFKNIINNGELIDTSFDFSYINFSEPVVINIGDVMYDTLILCLDIAKKRSDILNRLDLKPKEYYLATIHRAENTDNQEKLKNILEALSEISKIKPVIFPVHPRTQKLLKNLSVKINSDFKLIDPVSYFDMLTLEKNAEIIFTDSGGVQKEAYWLKVLCITLRNETEWVETVEAGWNILVGCDPGRIVQAASEAKAGAESAWPYGDGRAAERVLSILRLGLCGGQ